MPRIGWVIMALAVLTLCGCASLRGVYHTVQKGQTLYQIARSYDVDPEQLARLNGVRDPRRLAVGDRLFIPGASQVRRVPATVAGSDPPPAQIPVKKPPRPAPAPLKPAPAQKTAAVTAPASPVVVRQPLNQPSQQTSGRGSLDWPVRGSVVKKFGSKGDSPGRNGIEIATRTESAIFSSAAGKVIYSGNGIPGYGNLVIIQHEDSLYTIYGYNRKNLVTAGAFVGKGERIALSGVPPSGGIPRLYFEVRSGKKPVDPFFYLP